MDPLFRSALGLLLVASLSVPAGAANENCTRDALTVDGTAVAAAFCVPAAAAGGPVSVTETFAALGKTVSRTVALTVVPGAHVSRTIDDVDLTPLGIKRSLHMTLAARGGLVELEHALALPGATPVK